ncbi:MAG TPA: hypothetical protein VLI46_10485 [Ramlibacter sp.]|nr:hypothetical protein [Ramlibacter sp.]
MNKPLLFLAAVVLSFAAGAQESDSAERARIGAERVRADAAFRAEEKVCYTRFAVNDCLKAAQSRKREVLADLRRQEVALNDAERRRKAGERLRASEEKQRERAEPPARAGSQALGRVRGAQRIEPPALAASSPASAAREPNAPARKKARLGGGSGPQPSQGQPTPAEAAQNRKDLAQRQLQAEERRAQLERRLAGRTKPPAQPLPAAP